MKESFYAFYKLSEEKFKSIWKKGLLVVDTNVLLDLYRLRTESREDLKKSIEFFEDRIWLPYQAGLEYHRNRVSTINELGGNRYDEFEKTLNDIIIPKLKDAFNSFRQHPCIDIEYIEKKIDGFKKDLMKKSIEWKKKYPFNADNDDVLTWVTNKFDGKVGKDNEPKELLSIYREGEVRYKAQIPPGYKDANDKAKKEAGERYVYGDLIIWKSVVAKAKEDGVDIIFITNDNKEDWFERSKGQTKGPRFELIREFHEATGRDIIIMSEAAFLKEIKTKNNVKVKDSSIEDAKRAERPYSYWDSLLLSGVDGPTIHPGYVSLLPSNRRSLLDHMPVSYSHIYSPGYNQAMLFNPDTDAMDPGVINLPLSANPDLWHYLNRGDSLDNITEDEK